jgi:SAM-dependent methyltransferase
VNPTAQQLAAHAEILCCPGCGADVTIHESGLACGGCDGWFSLEEEIPRLYWPEDRLPGQNDLTEQIRAFYEETPFPDYDDFDSAATLVSKARQGRFARLLDEQVPPGARIIECGCGTGQLSNFLSLSNRTVFGTDLCLNSLRLGRRFASRHGIDGVIFAQMNLFRPAFRPGSFDLVISNGVLMTTVDPFEGFRSISRLVRPGGYILIGLYHRYGRLVTDARRVLFRLSGDRFQWLDPVLRSAAHSDARKRSWFADQYKHPHEMKHTIGNVLGWFRETGFEFVKSIPHSKPFRPFSETEELFRPEQPGNALERLVAELGMVFGGSREGGFFTMIGRRPS